MQHTLSTHSFSAPCSVPIKQLLNILSQYIYSTHPLNPPSYLNPPSQPTPITLQKPLVCLTKSATVCSNISTLTKVVRCVGTNSKRSTRAFETQLNCGNSRKRSVTPSSRYSIPPSLTRTNISPCSSVCHRITANPCWLMLRSKRSIIWSKWCVATLAPKGSRSRLTLCCSLRFKSTASQVVTMSY